MGMNKAQRQAAARTKQAEADVNEQIEQEFPITPAQPPVEQPKQEVKATVTPATPAVSKQQLTVMRLVVELRKNRAIEVKPEHITNDGKYVLITVGGEWPVFRIGTNGGVSLPQIRSYKEGFESWMRADELLKKQTERDAKKAATRAPKQEVAA